MKAKNLFKKSLAWMLTLVLIVLAVPMAAFVASAEATAAPAPDATDIGGKLVVVTTEALYNDFADDGVFTLGRTQGARFMDPVFGAGVVYASAKFKMNGNVHYNWNANAETGEYAYAGNYNNLGFDLGTATLGDGTSFVLHLSYRRNQGIYIMADSSCGKFVKTSGATKDLDELVLTVKYDPATYTFSIWENGVQKGDISYADQVDPAATDASKIKTITMNHFGIHNSDLGFTAENPEDVTNGNKTENTVTVSDVHLWGDVTAGKSATTAPTAGANSTDITANVTLSDAAMNADWKEDGKFAWAVAQNQYYTFNGIDFEKGNNKIVYATATFTNRASGGDGQGIYGTVFTSAGDYNYLRPAWNQQGLGKYNAEQLIANVVPAGDGTFAGDVWKATYKWDVDNDTVDVWLTTQFHQGQYNVPQGYGFPATFYVGRFYLKNCAPQFGLRTGPDAEKLSGTVNVQDVRVWEETAAATEGGSTTNVADSADVWVGGTMTAGTGSAVLTTVPNFAIGTTKDTDGVYDATGSAVRTRKTVYWDGLKGDLSKGTITYEADLTAYPPASSYERHSGFTVAIVDGHYVTLGVGVHNSDNKYRPYTFINGGNLNEGGATQTVLGGSASMSVSGQTITADAAGTVIKLKVVLSNDVIMFYVNGKLEQYYNVEGKNVVPFFGYLWQTGNASDNISNVKIYGDGVSSIYAGENMIGNATAYVGGQFVGGQNDKVLVKPPVMNAGTEIDTDGVYVTTGVGKRSKKTIVWKGLEGNLNNGVIIFEGKLTLNPSTDPGEIHNGFIPCMVDGQYVAMGLGYHTYNSRSDYFPQTFINAGNLNEGGATQTILGGSATMGSNIKVEATDAPGTANIKIVLTSESLTMYVNGTPAQTYNLTGKTVVPTFGFVWSSGNAADTLSDVKIYGAGVSVCSHEYDNDMDEDCNKCGTERVAPGKALPTIGENTNFAGNLVFENAGANAEYAENGTITTAGLNGKANGVLLGENGVAYIKTDITFNGNVDHNWSEVKVKNEETGEMEGTGTYAYSNAWGRTGVQIGTYYSTGRETRMSVYVTYRRCTGGVYVWDNAQEVNGSGNPVVVGNIAADLAALSFVVRYDSAANNVTVWANGAFVGTVSLEAFGEFAFALGVTQYGSGTTAVDPSDNTNPETTPNSVTFANFEVWGDLTATCVHEYDNDCDADCNKCGEGREVEGHVYDDNCADVDCNKCGATRPAAEHVFDDCTDTTCANCAVTREAADHVFDDDCQDTTCANCSATREAADHVYDDDCQDTTCANCSATREAADHVYDDDCQDTTCANCGVTRPAAEHVFDDDCQDTTCANCSATREAADHVYDDDCQDTTCANCGVTRPAAEHVFDDDCQDTTCANCSATREAADHVYDDDCQDTTCANCGVTRPAAEHVFDNDCQDTTCANCSATREAAEHVFDNDCQDTTCANCAVTREAADHVFDDDCQDTTCANCGVTREPAEHVFDDDCTDTTCANCSATREAADHVYENACDATCANCAVTRPVADHVYDDEYDPTCNVCGYEREVPERPSDIVIGSGDTQDKLEVVVGEVLPVLEKVGTKFVLGWTNSLGEVVTTYNGETDLVAEYVETLMMTVKYQVGTDGDSIRYIASVDQTERYTKVGWAFSLVNANPEVGGENVVVRDSSLVYQGLLADGQVKTAADIYGGADYAQYLYVFEITDIPEAAADSIIYVRPYVEMNDGTIVYGEVNAESLNTIKAK